MTAAPDPSWLEHVDGKPRKVNGTDAVGMLPPCDLDAEAAVLSAILLDASAMKRVHGLRGAHFFSDANRIIFRAFNALIAEGRPVDILTTRSWLRDNGLLDRAGGSVYLAQILDAVPAVANVEDYARTVREKWQARELVSRMQRLSAEGYTATDVAAFLERVGTDIRSITDEATPTEEPLPLRRVGELLHGAVGLARARMTGEEKPIPVAHAERAQCLGGGWWAPGVHFLISGTGAGKSQLVLEDTLAAAKAGVPCLYIGLELEGFQVALRFLGEESSVSWSKLYLGKCNATQLRLAEEAIPALELLPLFCDFSGPAGWPMSRLRKAIESMRAQYPTGPILVVLDYLQLVSNEEDAVRQLELRERIGKVAYLGRSLAVEFNAAIVVVSSTARNNYDMMSGTAVKAAGITMQPRGSDFSLRKVVLNPDALVGAGKESGEIEASADSVTVLLKWPTLLEGQRIVLAVVAKGRAMGASWCALVFDHGTRFLPFDVARMDDLPEDVAKATTGRPKTTDAEDRERIDKAIAHDSTIDSANRLIKVCQELGIGGNASRLRNAWKTYLASKTVSDEEQLELT